MKKFNITRIANEKFIVSYRIKFLDHRNLGWKSINLPLFLDDALERSLKNSALNARHHSRMSTFWIKSTLPEVDFSLIGLHNRIKERVIKSSLLEEEA